MKKKWMILASVAVCLSFVLSFTIPTFANRITPTENLLTVHNRLGDATTCSKCGKELSGSVGEQNTVSVALGLNVCNDCWWQMMYGNDYDTPILKVAQLGEDGKVLAEQLPAGQGGITGAGLDAVFTSNGLLKRTGTATYTVDANSYVTGTPWAEMGYLTGNQSITLSGDLSGSGTTSISGTVNGIKGVTLPALSTGYLYYTGSAFAFQTPAGGSNPSWYGKLYSTRSDCNPITQTEHENMLSVAGPTPTGITASIARCVQFTPPANITVANIRLFGVGATTSLYKFAIYAVGTSTAKLWDSGTVTSATNTWLNLTTGLPITLTAGTKYWWCVTVVSTGTTAGFRSEAAPLGTNYYGANVAPLGATSLELPVYAQFAVSIGVFPATLPSIAAAAYSGGTTGSVPFGWLDYGGAK